MPKVIDLQTRGMNETCLHKACREGSVDGVRLLLIMVPTRNNEHTKLHKTCIIWSHLPLQKTKKFRMLIKMKIM